MDRCFHKGGSRSKKNLKEVPLENQIIVEDM